VQVADLEEEERGAEESPQRSTEQLRQNKIKELKALIDESREKNIDVRGKRGVDNMTIDTLNDEISKIKNAELI
jgi:hypothetical protein